ncbi:hypothetical protein ACFL3S_06465 [Gemmatimonadota bacterium]
MNYHKPSISADPPVSDCRWTALGMFESDFDDTLPTWSHYQCEWTNLSPSIPDALADNWQRLGSPTGCRD